MQNSNAREGEPSSTSSPSLQSVRQGLLGMADVETERQRIALSPEDLNGPRGTWQVPRRSQPRILILQNDPCASLTLVRSIAGHGYLTSGPLARLEDADACVAENPPHLVVMDVVLEGGHTFDLARELRRKGIPFVFYTAWENIRQVPVDLRGVLFIRKPDQESLLLRVLSPMTKQGRAIQARPG